ncbi:bifunctional tRNA (5-methylaminomethyl-2-thiouridine)(34)-methyltransferase MnmD/FAD-dependent 5-carboxymethylaminomethyl-2-thiouridine(34) oxidoreductase MnmC [Neptuniibacter sp. CAU 1671]|uniref:bifunctional tRNA (5-methylaminomethyl-2-thiouridine)(34)-methyltransferase MnmD/FAD-dependent 5-carboxymethylaminomethyl-2-thiouridine(34) oxidoreductase MnmC n=1 Tax=Neptuniibacter sp. CAU 1671 TaxID=3032593 RepID=UPI0023DB7F06|nr:bifunctional tRNA (5-methylaminomethyl-2-thiouridine)(34)-methyltransferase MnmD/FAD-dependent 5-carboxymethylaminomethyl-2-thiouridine(34) oxidoreductase MnmC [Neptuniibacter sp. CAU 1671]MDF2181393.1 bifunctional tRNA (5-methylaminomethyl-2-thiouridine)(34)-methyltransferase MnmD/FAD-dependent 5-carboxymethylaminomethyl-2-thiouridine(34) oxidoreductase MnmC [Neptuniibacter sp. CAU 1671]
MRVTWRDHSPHSEAFDDIYFNPLHGKEESLYVFWQGNLLNEKLAGNVQTVFTIAETGFGTGLNFLCTAQSFIGQSKEAQCLHFISVEKYPLALTDLAKSHTCWPEFKSLSDQLIQQYPPSTPGVYTLAFLEGRIKLTLIIGDAASGFSQLSAMVDAWYLDGFAPSKNPEMWSDALFQQMARLSHKGTTFATFTAAGAVRRGLQAVGFEVEKRKGFGQKRERLVGRYLQDNIPEPTVTPWFDLPSQARPEQVVISGAGLAGCTTAWALAQRGIKVTVLDAADKPAQGGSGNPQGALYTKLSVKPTLQSELHLCASHFSLNLLRQLDPEQTFWSECEVVQIATDDAERTRQQALINEAAYPQEIVEDGSKDTLSKLTQQTVTHDGLIMKLAGWVSPADFCRALLNHPCIDYVPDSQLTELTYQDGMWIVQTAAQKTYHTSTVILCQAEATSQFVQTQHLPLKPIRGQVSIIPASVTNQKLNQVICGDGYISPPFRDHYCFGATFELKSTSLEITDSGHDTNLHNLAKVLPDLAADFEKSKHLLTGRVSFRCSTPDYLPIVGPAPDPETTLERFAPLRKDRKWKFSNVSASHLPGLYVNCGHGSKGLVTTPLCGEYLAALICAEPLPMRKPIHDALNPSRFLIKNLIRKQI